MRTTTLGRTLGSLALVILSACSGGASPSPTDEATGETAQRLESDPAAGSAGAAPADERHGHFGHGHERGGLIRRFDQNKDGQLALAELPEKLQERFRDADTNRDGILSEDELRARHAQFEQKRMERLDTNGDGTVSDEERAAARAEFQKKHFARKDKNGDGALTADEVGERHWEHLKAADADGNGAVTAAEMDQAIASGTLQFKGHRHHFCAGDGRDDAPPTKS